MAQITRDQLHNSLERGLDSSVYLLYGEENYLMNESLKGLKERALQGGLEDLNLDMFYGQDSEMGKIVDTMEQLPMMANCRVVVVKELQDIKDRELEKLLICLKEPMDTTVVILMSSRIDKRKKNYKQLLGLSHLTAVEFRSPYENEIPRWISQMAQKRGLRLSIEARDCLHQLIGNNLNEIEGELRKLSQYMDGKKTVEREDVTSVISRSKVDSVFDLANAIGDNRRQQAFACLSNLMENGQSEVGILMLVARHIRLLSAVKEGCKKQLSTKQLGADLGVSPYFLKDYISQSHKWSREKLQKAVVLLGETDRALKSSALSSRIHLESFLLNICR